MGVHETRRSCGEKEMHDCICLVCGFTPLKNHSIYVSHVFVCLHGVQETGYSCPYLKHVKSNMWICLQHQPIVREILVTVVPEMTGHVLTLSDICIPLCFACCHFWQLHQASHFLKLSTPLAAKNTIYENMNGGGGGDPKKHSCWQNRKSYWLNLTFHSHVQQR